MAKPIAFVQLPTGINLDVEALQNALSDAGYFAFIEQHHNNETAKISVVSEPPNDKPPTKLDLLHARMGAIDVIPVDHLADDKVLFDKANKIIYVSRDIWHYHLQIGQPDGIENAFKYAEQKISNWIDNRIANLKFMYQCEDRLKRMNEMRHYHERSAKNQWEALLKYCGH